MEEFKNTLPHVIYYNNDHSESWKCTDEISALLKCTYSLPNTWGKLISDLEEDGKFLIFHADMISAIYSSPLEFLDTLATIARAIPNATQLKISVIVSKDTPLRIVKELQKTSVQGIIPDCGEFTMEQCATGINALVNGIPYWPKDILKELPGAIKRKSSKNSIQLTPRQLQVFNLIKSRGASNKVIARSLGISESTVKLHVTEIFKKYGVKNRTQLAVLSSN